VGEREQKIRWAVEGTVSDLVDRQAADDGSGDRGWARAIVALREHGARLLEPPPQLFAVLELPEGFSQSVVVDVPVPSTAGDFVVSVRATLRDLASYEHWSGSVLRAGPAESDFAELKARTRELVEAARARRAQEARAVPCLREAPGPRGEGPWLRAVEPDASRSRFGGVPFLPAGMEWPRRVSGRPLHFLAQLDLREAPAGDVLPADGTLAFFHDAEHDPWGDDADGSAVIFAPPGTDLVPLVPPAETPDDFVRPAAGIRFSAGAGEPAHRLLGEPDPIQHDPRAPGWALLLQLDSGEPLGFDLGDAGRIYFLMREPDVAARAWERARLVFQCH
jgi:hypothetical protein